MNSFKLNRRQYLVMVEFFREEPWEDDFGREYNETTDFAEAFFVIDTNSYEEDDVYKDKYNILEEVSKLLQGHLQHWTEYTVYVVAKDGEWEDIDSVDCK